MGRIFLNTDNRISLPLTGDNDIGSMAPFSPGMFLNDVGEASNDKLDKGPNLEEDSLL